MSPTRCGAPGPAVALVALVAAWTGVAISTAAAEGPSATRYAAWLEGVALLISDEERETFLALSADYRRDEFIRRFWKARDPFPGTAVNEFRQRWEERVARAQELYGSLEGERASMLLRHGEPDHRRPVSCSGVLRPIEVWTYTDGSEHVPGAFTLVFVGGFGRGRGLTLWQPTDGLRALLVGGAELRGFADLERTRPGDERALSDPVAPRLGSDRRTTRRITRECPDSRGLFSDLSRALGTRFDPTRDLPRPSDEWLKTFAGRSTDVAADVETLSGELAWTFPARHQSRTVVQGLLAVPQDEVLATGEGSASGYRLRVDGEILRRDELFESFRYRFDFPAGEVGELLPLVLQRYLRPGSYEVIVKVTDLGSGRVFRDARQLSVPRVDRQPVAAPGTTALAAVPATPPTPTSPPAPALAGTKDATPRAGDLGEANASLSTGDHAIKILALPDLLVTGRLRVRTRVRGEGVARVAFEVDGQRTMSKSRPPYSVEIDVGAQPRLRSLRAVALDSGGEVLADDEVMINAGPHRFGVRLLEPRQGRTYRQSLRAHAAVDVPEGERLDRLEIYLGESLLATLYGPPYEQPILLPDELGTTYVRAVAYLRDGDSAEDVTFINAPDFVDRLDVHMVELFTSVADKKGELVEGLEAVDFTVREDGEVQPIRRFEPVRDLPFRAGVVLDTSTSMAAALRDVERAAYRFFDTVLTPKDRAAVITFADQPHLAVRFTNDPEILAGGLAGLSADGETALYDSIIFALHYFNGLRGKRAVIVLTDGEDSTSTFSYNDAFDFARHTGVAIYIIGLGNDVEPELRAQLSRLASATGGDTFFIDNARQLDPVYDTIQREIRSQYLIAYQSPQQGDAFREVEVEVHRPGLVAKTIAGYSP